MPARKITEGNFKRFKKALDSSDNFASTCKMLGISTATGKRVRSSDNYSDYREFIKLSNGNKDKDELGIGVSPSDSRYHTILGLLYLIWATVLDKPFWSLVVGFIGLIFLMVAVIESPDD